MKKVLSLLGYCRNMKVQHVGGRRRRKRRKRRRAKCHILV